MSLKGGIQYLDDNIEEMDFSAMLGYLEERYEGKIPKLEGYESQSQILDK